MKLIDRLARLIVLPRDRISVAKRRHKMRIRTRLSDPPLKCLDSTRIHFLLHVRLPKAEVSLHKTRLEVDGFFELHDALVELTPEKQIDSQLRVRPCRKRFHFYAAPRNRSRFIESP